MIQIVANDSFLRRCVYECLCVRVCGVCVRVCVCVWCVCKETDVGEVTVHEGLTSSPAVSPAENTSPAVTDDQWPLVTVYSTPAIQPPWLTISSSDKLHPDHQLDVERQTLGKERSLVVNKTACLSDEPTRLRFSIFHAKYRRRQNTEVCRCLSSVSSSQLLTLNAVISRPDISYHPLPLLSVIFSSAERRFPPPLVSDKWHTGWARVKVSFMRAAWKPHLPECVRCWTSSELDTAWHCVLVRCISTPHQSDKLPCGQS